MYKHPSNAHLHLFSHTCFFIRDRWWPLLLPSLAVVFLVFCPQASYSLQINVNDYQQANTNPDRTIVKLGPRDLQEVTTSSPSFDDQSHALYVVTLDGKITAIDADANGRHLWTADTGSALIDSSLSKIEISRDSRSVRLIPSLIGGLFEKYDEDGHVEPLPFDADALLDASFKLHDELVITGGKHIDTIGLDLHTGQVLYSFSKDDSKQSTRLDNNRTASDDQNDKATLVIKRTTQTVRARSARNGYEKWNFSVSNQELLHLRAQPTNIVLERVDLDKTARVNGKTFASSFEYQLQTGVVLAFGPDGHPLWSSAINAPIAAVWELKNGQLSEKSLFETAPLVESDDDDDDDRQSSPPLSRRLAFVGEFNSTPYVIVSPKVQKQLIYDARRIAGTQGSKRPVLSSWQKAYQKRTLSIDADTTENNYPRVIGMAPSDNNYPLALRPDPNAHHPTLSHPTTGETCDTAGYLELIHPFLEECEQRDLIVSGNTHRNDNLPAKIVTLSSVFLGAVIIALVWYYKHKQTEFLRQLSLTSNTSISTDISPPPTPQYHQIEQPSTPPFQSRYTLEYEHIGFLGRGGFGVVFEAINKLDERRVAIKRVSLKKASGKERALKEIRYLAVLNHPNLIQYYYAWNESPPVGWQEEADKTLLIRNSNATRDSISSFPTSGNDSESIVSGKSPSASVVHAVKPPTTSPSPLLDFTFDRTSNPLRIDEDFSNKSVENNDKSDLNDSSSSSSSSDDQVANPIDANNNTKSSKRNRSSTTTKSSISSSSPLFDHSIDSSSFTGDEIEHHLEEKERTDSDDGIVFLHDEKKSSSHSPPPTQSRSLLERKKCTNNEKESPPTYFYFVMELCQPESLRDRLIHRSVTRPQAWLIFDQIIKGIEYIHSQKLIHRDLKPSNILFSLDNTVKIGDFGLVSAFGEDKLAKKKKRDEDIWDITQPVETGSFISEGCGNNEIGGTILYMSPEQIRREPYNQKVDIYAMGIILFELLYPCSTQMERMHAIAKLRLAKPEFPADFESDGSTHSQWIHRFIWWLLSHSPKQRPRASEVRQSTLYQRLLQREVPSLCNSESRPTHLTVVSGQDQSATACQQQQGRGRISSSPFRRTVSSSFLQSHRDSESVDAE